MRYALALGVGVFSWYMLTICFGVMWTLLGLSYNPAHSNLLNFALLPLGLFIGWRFANRSQSPS